MFVQTWGNLKIYNKDMKIAILAGYPNKMPILPFYPPYWFSLNNAETVKAATLVFCSIQ